MLRKPLPFEIKDKAKPFAGDKLSLEGIARTLTTIISSANQPFTITVEAPWGWGKTTFITMWKQELENEKFQAVRFNAWETDYLDDPLITFIGELEEYFGKDNEHLKRMKDSAIKLAKSAAPLVPDLSLPWGGLFSKVILGWLAKAVETKIENYEASKAEIKNFKSELANFAAKLSKRGKAPLIVIVDELDRCRPIYAVSFLERIKHLFNVPGVTFVLAIDAGQITDTVRAIYGMGSEQRAEEYLRRFIDYRFRLPTPSTLEFCKHLTEHFNLQSIPALEVPFNRGKVVELIAQLFELKGLGLRDQEQCFTEIALAFSSLQGRNDDYQWLVPFFVTMRQTDYSLYSRIRDRKHEWDDVVMWVTNQGTNNSLQHDRSMNALEAFQTLYYSQTKETRDRGIETIYNNAASEDSQRKGGRWTRTRTFLNKYLNDRENPVQKVISQLDLLEEIAVTPGQPEK